MYWNNRLLRGTSCLTPILPKDPVSLFIAGAITGASSGVAFYAVAAVASIGISAVVSYALQALTPKQSGGTGAAGLLVNSSNPTAPREFVYGRVRKGGTVTYREKTGTDGKFLHLIIVLAGHEIDAIEGVYINDQLVTINGSNFVTSHGWNSKIRIKRYLGTASQTADPDLLAETAQVDANFRGRGIAYLYVRLEYDKDVFSEGIPLFTALIRGKKVLDTRTSVTAYSNNWALCVRDFLTASYGFADSASSIDTTYLNVAANVCDEVINSQARFTMDGVFSSEETAGDVLRKMMTAGAGTLFWGQGKWHIKPGYFTSSVYDITLDDLRGPITIQPRRSTRDNFNTVRGKFVNEGRRWIETDYPTVTSATYLAQDNGEEKIYDMAMPFTTNVRRCQRIARIALNRTREQITWSAEFGMNLARVEIGDTVRFTNPRYGWNLKSFEIVDWQFVIRENVLRIALTLVENSSAIYTAGSENTILDNDTNLPDPFANLTLTLSGSVTSTSILGFDGRLLCSAFINWNAAQTMYLENYQVQWKIASRTRWLSTVTEESSIELTALREDTLYDCRIRAITTLGTRGPWLTFQFTPTGDVTAPALPTNIAAFGIDRGIQLFWDNPSDSDFARVQIWENTSNTTSGATLIQREAGETYIRKLPRNTVRWYFLRSVDRSGNASAFSAGVRGRSLGKYDALNLVPDDELIDRDGWSNPANFQFEDSVTAAAASEGKARYIGALPRTVATALEGLDKFKVKPGQTLFCFGQMNASGGNANVDFQIRFYDKDQVTIVSTVTFANLTVTASSATLDASGSIAVPAGATYASYYYRVASCTADVQLLSPTVYRKTNLDTTGADSVNAAKLVDNAVERPKILDNAVSDGIVVTALTAAALTTTFATIATLTLPAFALGEQLQFSIACEARAVSGGNTLLNLETRVDTGGGYGAWEFVAGVTGTNTVTRTTFDYERHTAGAVGPFVNRQYRIQARVTVASATTAIRNVCLATWSSKK